MAVGGLNVGSAQQQCRVIAARVRAQQVDGTRPGDNVCVRQGREVAVRESCCLFHGPRADQEAGVPAIGAAGNRIVGVVAPADDFEQPHHTRSPWLGGADTTRNSRSAVPSLASWCGSPGGTGYPSPGPSCTIRPSTSSVATPERTWKNW